jgi:hypothetical protein
MSDVLVSQIKITASALGIEIMEVRVSFCFVDFISWTMFELINHVAMGDTQNKAVTRISYDFQCSPVSSLVKTNSSFIENYIVAPRFCGVNTKSGAVNAKLRGRPSSSLPQILR